MDEDSALQAKIVDLAGRINRHKAAGTHSSQSSPSRKPMGTGELYAQRHNWLIRIPSSKDYSRSWAPQRGTPYGTPRGHEWKHTRPVSHRNRTLVLNKNTIEAPSSGPNMLHADESNPSGWVTKHDRHMQLINNSVYDKKVQERTHAIEETRRQQRLRQGQQEKALVQKHLLAVAPHDTTAPAHFIVVNNIRFVVADGGSKLIKTNDDSNKLHIVPKRADVGGVTFYRSKHGNLYRAGLIKNQRSGRRIIFATPDPELADLFAHRQAGISKSSKPCLQFSTTGTCPKGPSCRYIHDPDKVAMCKDFLQKGECRAGAYCDLSHDPTPERVPACLHFLRGSCTNASCRYAHVRVNPGAPVCKAFANYGFCPKGINCTQRHIHECPDYANKGFCRNPSCHLPHVDRAGQLRKATAARGSGDEDETMSDVSSEEEGDSDDVDSDEIDEELLVPNENNHELSQQSDYVSL